jgi:molybdopterin/thiamine biosynthesis adenylyltransferase
MTEVTSKYQELISRNWGFISPDLQSRMRETSILLAGCGLGSNIALLAARTGFSKFILADGDSVEINNLNRQTFLSSHIGRNKAEATAELIKGVNSEAEINIFPEFISENNTLELVSKADFIINTVDPGPVLFKLNSEAQIQNKVVLFPLNIGFGGLAFVFTNRSSTLEEMTGDNVPVHEVFFSIIKNTVKNIPYLSFYVGDLSKSIDDILSGKLPGPQLGIAAGINSALIVTAMIKILRGEELTLAPEPIAYDAWFSNQQG